MNFNHIWVIRNPVAGWKSLKHVNQMLEILATGKKRLVVHDTLYSGHAEHLALKACKEQADLLIVAGGDGTLNEVVNGIVVFKRKHKGVIPLLAIFPSGTVNLVAKELGVTDAPASFTRLIDSEKERVIWPAKVNGRYFLTSVGIGFDAFIVNNVSSCCKRKFSKLAYIYQACRLLAGKWRERYDISVDGTRYHAAAVIAVNSHYYAGRFAAVASAALTDQQVYLCIFTGSSRWDLFTYILYLLCSRLDKHKHVIIVGGKRATVSGSEKREVQVDGDIAVALPVRISGGDMPIRILSSENQP